MVYFIVKFTQIGEPWRWYVLYMNLKAEMARNGITNEQLANGIGINPSTMSAKLNIAGRMRLDEAQNLRDKFFPDMTMDYLFGDTQPSSPKKSA